MSDGDEIFRRLQSAARSASARTGVATPTQEYLTRHLIESFLERLTRTVHNRDFVLKGGILLAAYGVRRPTKDADSNAVSIDVTAEELGDVINDVAQVVVDDGVVFDMTSTTVQDIREHADYPGLRVRVKASIGTWRGVLAWDVTTGDPIVPAPKLVRIERVLGEPIELLGYAPEATIAEKGVTILERGIASTRWRDYVDIVQLARRGIDEDELLRSSRAVATYRGVVLEPVSRHLEGYADLGQAKWAAWRRREGLQGACEESLEGQVALVASYLDPVFARGPQ
jgi:hypothetical protein